MMCKSTFDTLSTVRAVVYTVLTLLVCDIHAQTEAKITASDPATSARFGSSVSIDGDRAIIGATGDDHAGPSSGTAYIFTHNHSGWIQEAKLTAHDASAYSTFGFSVAIDGDVAVVGAPILEPGAAYVFRRTATGWIQEAKLVATSTDPTDNFGFAVAVDGDVIVVGADEEPIGGTGSAYVFVRNNAGWVQQAKLTASDAATHAEFGASVDVSGSNLLVGAPSDDAAGGNAGAAYIFNLCGTTWHQTAKVTSSDISDNDLFGNRVAIDGGVAVVGAPYDDHAGFGSGSAYIFRKTGSDWAQDSKIIAADADQRDGFGWCVSIDGNMAIVGAGGKRDPGYGSGSAYIFKSDGAAWNQELKLNASDASASAQFGLAVAISGVRALVGASGDDIVGHASGSAYVYELPFTTIHDIITVVDNCFDDGYLNHGQRQALMASLLAACRQLDRENIPACTSQLRALTNKLSGFVRGRILPASVAQRIIDGTCDVIDHISTGSAKVSSSYQSMEEAVPSRYSLFQNHPNPFNPNTSISFSLPEATWVTIEIYNILGRRITTLVNDHYSAGDHSVVWDGTERTSGMYFYRISTEGFVETRKMMLLK